MNTNPLKKGVISKNFAGVGSVTHDMVNKRAIELAIIGGRSAQDMSQSDWEQAKRELTGEPDADPNDAMFEAVPESERLGTVPFTTGHQTPAAPNEDEDDEGRSESEQLVEEGVAEAEHDQMLQAAKAAAKKINEAFAELMHSVLTINGGSSSIKFVLYQTGEPLERKLSGKVDRIGLPGTNLTFSETTSHRQESRSIAASDNKSAASFLIDWFEEQPGFASVKAVGHRVVHGMQHTAPELVTPELLTELQRLRPYDPEHLPREIELIEAFRQRHPQLPQIACFDTAFHCTMPRVAKLLPIPRRFDAKGVQRYGFHGLSYAYLMEELARLGDPAATQGRVILAHLGNGASLAAVRDGKSIDTSMGFTPTAGLVMSTRSGDLDPGLAPYLERTEKITAKQFYDMVNQQSGLLGVSEISPDMRDLLAQEAADVRAAEAVALFCYQAKKWIGAFTSALGGLETLVFAGGIGENCPPIRTRVCDGLGFLGIELDETRNATNAPLISTAAGRVAVRVIRTDEELMIARSVCRVLGLDSAAP